ncbi:hypothetical protein ES703_29843 [subsurface metagenome]
MYLIIANPVNGNKIAFGIAGVLPLGASRLTAVPLFDLDRVEKLMDGAIDNHEKSGSSRIKHLGRVNKLG